jgi:HlyD family secretion protein
MTGRVTRLAVEQGETAVPGTFNKDAATLLTIADMSVLETKVKVDETDVARIEVGDSAIVQIDAFPDTTSPRSRYEASRTAPSNTCGRGPAVRPPRQWITRLTIQLLDPAARDTRLTSPPTARS